MAEVALAHIHKTYPPDVSALRDFNLEIADGELMVLVGPSGCGKTTTLRLIAGLERPTGGTIRIGGRIANDVPPRDRDVAMVFQRQALYPHLSVRENLGFGLRMKRGWWPWGRAGPAAAQRIDEAARMLGLETVLDRRPGQLSGGQQQRVALGRALVRQPAVFLLDEPLSHLDSRLRADLRRELHLLHRQLRATMVYVTHDPVEAMTLADRVAVLDGGTVQQVDRPLTVYEKPANRRVAEFFGWPPMNLIDGRIVTAENRVRFQTADGLTLPVEDRAGADRPVTLGIRPEALQIVADFDNIRDKGTEHRSVRLRVMLVEPLGYGMLVTLQHKGLRLIGQAENGTAVQEGQEVELIQWAGHSRPAGSQSGKNARPTEPTKELIAMIDPNQMHWFDCITGRALATG